MGPLRKLSLPDHLAARREVLLSREWLLTNGIGGYASGTLGGVPTRRYHGLLTAALPNPLGRTVMLTELAETVELADGSRHRLTGEELVSGELHLPGVEHLTAFHLERGLPLWRYEIGGAVLERRVLLVHQQNTSHVTYRLVSSEGPVRLRVRPAMSFRPHEAPVSRQLWAPYELTARDGWLEIAGDPTIPPLRLQLTGARGEFAVSGRRMEERLYRVEESRGYEAVGELWSPGHFHVELQPGEEATLIASTEPWTNVLALAPEAARSAELERRRRLVAAAPVAARTGVAAELVLAADAFIVSPAYRAGDLARARATGEEMRTVIAGYHWFADWGRDTMISLEGLTLCTGRAAEAASVLKTFADYTRDGLIPNLFPEGSNEGLYHTADASLWFFHAVDRYVRATGDRCTLDLVLPALRSILDWHLRGTHYGIRIDPEDGLMTQGEEGYQLTWMDAKVEDWVVTPRRGKAVELNALWYNALRLMAGWLRERDEHEAARELDEHASRAYDSFNRRFWNPDEGCLFDLVDIPTGEDDPACRPNQLFAITLAHPVLERDRWEPVIEKVRECLLTPVGLRSLSPDHPQYQATYYGDLRTRDAAYHQGTVWGWLIGPFVDAWLRVHPEDREGARRHLEGLLAHLDDFGVGSVAEIFDAEAPFTARGCIAQAWSVAELLRCLLNVELGD
jgi:predicted glycogen debranching enzyme